MDTGEFTGLAQALQSLTLPPEDPKFDDLLAQLDAIAAPHCSVNGAPSEAFEAAMAIIPPAAARLPSMAALRTLVAPSTTAGREI